MIKPIKKHHDWYDAEMGNCGCGKWARRIEGMCAERHDAEDQFQLEGYYITRIKELELQLLQAKTKC